MRRLVATLVSIAVVGLLNSATVLADSTVFFDDFEDGQIDTSNWVVGGRRTSWTTSNQGTWTWSHQEVIATDGYLNIHSQGPTSANSYGATPWLRSTFDLNDGIYHTMNFTWNVSVPQRWCDLLVQIVDGDNLPTFAQSNWGANLTPPNNWLYSDSAGTKNLLWSQRGANYLPGLDFPDYYGTSQKTTWSITTTPSGVARLYNGPNGSGTMLTQTTLDQTQHWYTRFMHYSGTSAGLPAGNANLNLYDVSVSSMHTQGPPTPQPRSDPTPLPPTTKPNLVLYTHGILTSSDDFNNPDKTWQQLGNSLSAEVDSATWEVQGYYWGYQLTPGAGLDNAVTEGLKLGSQIAKAGYDHVHLIAHSAGANLIATAAQVIRAKSPNTVIQTTYLDPYAPLSTQVDFYGKYSDWSDNYFAHDFPTGYFTERLLPNAHNVDVTFLDPDLGIAPSGMAWSSHGWPVEFYMDTANYPNWQPNYGFARSLEGGGWSTRSSYPQGNDPPVVLGIGNQQAVGGGSERFDDTVNVQGSSHCISDTGLLAVTNSKIAMTTGSPVWISIVVEPTGPVNLIRFDADFVSAAGRKGCLRSIGGIKSSGR